MQGTGRERVECFSFILHAHLPYVLHHGTWPHGLEWLLEIAAETYLPLLAAIRRLSADGIRFPASISFTPILLEQLSAAAFRSEMEAYLQRKIQAAREDAAFFEQANEGNLLELAHHWEAYFLASLAEWELLRGDIVAGFRQAEQGGLTLMTSAATHGYPPLLGTDGSLSAQFTTAVLCHKHHFGKAPMGAWLPECGYRPAGKWRLPVASPEGAGNPLQDRAGVEQVLQKAGLRHTFVDFHLFEEGRVTAGDGEELTPSLHRPYRIADSDVAVFARDPRTAFQVWSAQHGYPGDFQYLDFHKKRWPGGHRYWRVTGAGVGMEGKEPYHQPSAAERASVHADHFVELVGETLRGSLAADAAPPFLCAPFDLELFGHWWHEGVAFLEHMARRLHDGAHGIEAISCEDYLSRYGVAGSISMPEGSWGAEGDNSVWLNHETLGLQQQVYEAELAVRDASGHPAWISDGAGTRLARQMCRELLLMESSDWPTLITTGAARDYAEQRFNGHAESFRAVLAAWRAFTETGELSDDQRTLIEEIERVDGVFPAIDPADWRR